MSKIKYTVALVFGLLFLFTSSTHSRENVKQENQNMRNWGIIPAKEFLVFPVPDIPDCGIGGVQSTGRPYTKEIYLRRPGGRYACAVICSMKNGNVLLNPKGFDYGPIPPLYKITQSQADLLWGTKNGKTIDGEIVTFKLLPNFAYKTDKVVLLDLVFENNRIKKYRIRSEFLNSKDWTFV